MSSNRIRVGYLAGTSYSGSTLLAFLFNSHPEIASVSEITPGEFEGAGYACSCGERMVECPFFQEIADRMKSMGCPINLEKMELRFQYSENKYINRIATGHLRSKALDRIRDRAVAWTPPLQERLQYYLRRNEAFFEATLQTAGAKVYFDATKVARRIRYLSPSSRIDLKIIHLARDPRAQAFSAMDHEGVPAEAAARNWIRVHEKILENIEGMRAEDTYLLRYEDFCSDPPTEYSNVCEFLGVREHTFPEDFRDQDHHIIGNAMRRKSGSSGAIRLDTRWVDGMNEEDKRIVGEITRPIASRLGYDI